MAGPVERLLAAERASCLREVDRPDGDDASGAGQLRECLDTEPPDDEPCAGTAGDVGVLEVAQRLLRVAQDDGEDGDRGGAAGLELLEQLGMQLGLGAVHGGRDARGLPTGVVLRDHSHGCERRRQQGDDAREDQQLPHASLQIMGTRGPSTRCHVSEEPGSAVDHPPVRERPRAADWLPLGPGGPPGFIRRSHLTRGRRSLTPGDAGPPTSGVDPALPCGEYSVHRCRRGAPFSWHRCASAPPVAPLDRLSRPRGVGLFELLAPLDRAGRTSPEPAAHRTG